jgi:hypothetical protein
MFLDLVCSLSTTSAAFFLDITYTNSARTKRHCEALTELVGTTKGAKWGHLCLLNPGQPRPPCERKDQHRGLQTGKHPRKSVHRNVLRRDSDAGRATTVGSLTCAYATNQKHVPL